MVQYYNYLCSYMCICIYLYNYIFIDLYMYIIQFYCVFLESNNHVLFYFISLVRVSILSETVQVLKIYLLHDSNFLNELIPGCKWKHVNHNSYHVENIFPVSDIGIYLVHIWFFILKQPVCRLLCPYNNSYIKFWRLC